MMGKVNISEAIAKQVEDFAECTKKQEEERNKIKEEVKKEIEDESKQMSRRIQNDVKKAMQFNDVSENTLDEMVIPLGRPVLQYDKDTMIDGTTYEVFKGNVDDIIKLINSLK